MAAIVARTPSIDWSRGIDRHWMAGSAAATHALNALSFLFPQAERFFIETAREVGAGMGAALDPQLVESVRGFVAQELAHTHQHRRYNAILESQGFANVVEGLLERLQAQGRRRFSPLTRLAIVCGYEHYTAVLGDFILSRPEVLKGAQPELALIWGWHSAEETEHKSVCFDLYRAAGGGWLRRVLVFALVTINFSLMFARLYASLLYRDGCLGPARLRTTAVEMRAFFFGRAGIARFLLRDGLRYLSPRFHPWDRQNRDRLEAWLAANRHRLRESGAGPG
jgi:predicted metal-dependent hydrolase